VTKVDDYRAVLRGLDNWDLYLAANSNLPGPRANLELVWAVAEEGSSPRLHDLVAAEDEYLVVCGLVGLGRVVAEGEDASLDLLRAHASDPRWRVREAVAMGLQRLGDADPVRLVDVVEDWAASSPLEQRAAAAAICEPRLLHDPVVASAALDVLESMTRSLLAQADRSRKDVRVLRAALGYCWCVAIVAAPDRGRQLFEHLATLDDPDARWIVRENLGKARLRRMDSAWIDRLMSGPPSVDAGRPTGPLG
jgi:hypothetical protein